jgi:hypothetical protein
MPHELVPGNVINVPPIDPCGRDRGLDGRGLRLNLFDLTFADFTSLWFPRNGDAPRFKSATSSAVESRRRVRIES